MRIVLMSIMVCCLHAVDVDVSVVGMRIVGAGIGDDGQELQPFNWQSGTSIALRIHLPGGGILGIDKDASSLEVLIDDKGTDLSKSRPGAQPWNNGGIGAFPSISSDKRYVQLEINGPGLPIASAKTIKAQGHVALMCASKYESEAMHGIDIKEGTVIQSKKVHYTISSIGKPDWGDAAMQITLKTNNDNELIKSIIFKDRAGAVIEVQQGFTSRMGWNGEYTTEVSYNFPDKIDQMDMLIETWMDKKNIKVPFTVQAGVGLP